MSEHNISKAAAKASSYQMGETGGTDVIDSYGRVVDRTSDLILGTRGHSTIEEMIVDTTVSSVLFAIDMTMRRSKWSCAPSENQDNEKAREYAEFFETVLKDMDHTFDDFISQCLSMVPFGWSAFEKVYKIRKGPYEKDSKYRSRYTDGLYGVRKLAFRPQRTLDRWEATPKGDILGMHQQINNGKEIGSFYIPVDRMLMFRTTAWNDSPCGRSALLGAVEPWTYRKMIDKAEANGIERELSGLPILYAPADLLQAAGDGEAEAVQALAEYAQIVKDVRMNKQGGVILPSDTFQSPSGEVSAQRQFHLELLTSGGQRSIDPSRSVERHQINIARTVLADFLMLGTGSKTGSQALGTSRIDFFTAALDGWNEAIASELNAKLITDLGSLNGFDPKYLPEYKPAPAKPVDVETLVKCIAMYANVGGAILPDERIDDAVRIALNLPPGTSQEILDGEPIIGRAGNYDETDNDQGNTDAQPKKDPVKTNGKTDDKEEKE